MQLMQQPNAEELYDSATAARRTANLLKIHTVLAILWSDNARDVRGLVTQLRHKGGRRLRLL